MAETFVTYMLRCADGSYYAGHTDNLERRIGEHEEGGKCAYTECTQAGAPDLVAGVLFS